MEAMNLFELVEFRAEKYNARLLYDSENARLVLFSLEAGQGIDPHSAPSTVVMCALQGAGSFIKGEEVIPVKAGSLVPCGPNELHGMKADKGERLVALAFIAPRPH